MGHLHACYTSCRRGLSGQPGFQFNAASPQLSDEMRRELAAAHAGYAVPRDSPAEPSPHELAAFPVTLKHRPVENVGSVLSRTVYVGREFRGSGGEPDSGRFGNYFSHIVVGASGPAPFGELLPIELWDAPHWITTESTTPELAPLAALAPGALDLESALAQLGERRAPMRAVVLDGCLAALAGGPRIVLVEPDAACAAAWVAWVSFALPQALARQLTFSTYDGRPRQADVHLCVTLPSCDLGFAAYELDSRVRVLRPLDDEPVPDADVALYARAAADLARTGAEALSSAVRALPADADTTKLGAELAVAGQRAALAAGPELADVLDVCVAHGARGRWGPATAVAALPGAATDPVVVAGWARLHATARLSTDPLAQDVVDAAIDRLLPHVEQLGTELPAVADATPTNPSVDRLARWLEAVEHQPPAGVARQIAGGLTLGLLGRNAALDRRLGAAIAGALGDPEADAVFERLAGAPVHAPIAAEVGTRLAERAAADPEALAPLRRAAGNPVVWTALERWSREPERGFRERFIFASLVVAADPAARPAELASLAGLAQKDVELASLPALFPGGAPDSPAEHVELLNAYRTRGVAARPADVARALACLARVPAAQAGDAQDLAVALVDADPQLRSDPVLFAWRAAHDARVEHVEFTRWAGWVQEATSARAEPAPSLTELRRLAGDAAVRMLAAPDYERALGQLAATFGRQWPRIVAEALARGLAQTVKPERLLARVYVAWNVLPDGTWRLDEQALPDAVADWSAKQLARVAAELPDDEWREAWEAWCERHPPRSGIGRVVGRVLRREDAP